MGDSTPNPDRVKVASLRSVKDSFDRVRRIFSTRLAEGFDAVDKTTRESVVLWLLRFPFGVGSDEAQYFVRRLTAISQIDAITPRILSFGVDGAGQPYLVCEPVSGRALVHLSGDGASVDVIFFKMLRAVSRLHRAGWHLGDVSEDTFVLDDAGDVRIVGLMGHFDTGARKTAMLPPVETLHFVAPEQRGGGIADTLTDVYALGVYGYRLFTGRYLVPDWPIGHAAPSAAAIAPAPSLLRPNGPAWLDYILGQALQVDRDQRFKDATECFEAIQNIRERGGRMPTSAVWSRGTVLVGAQNLSDARASAVLGGVESTGAEASERKFGEPLIDPGEVATTVDDSSWVDRVLPVATWVVAIGIGIVVAVAIFLNLERGTPEPILAKSGARSVPPEESRGDATALLRTASNIELPIGDRVAAYQHAYTVNSVDALSSLASAAISSAERKESQDRLTGLLREWLAQRVPGRVRSDAGPGALLFADPVLRGVVAEELSQAVRTFSLGDAQEVLLGLLEGNDDRLRAVSQELLATRVLPPLRSVFLDSYLREPALQMPVEVRRSLVRGSVGLFAEADVLVLKRWTSPAAEPALLAAAATVQDPSVALDAFDVAVQRPLRLEPGASLVSWLKGSGLWEQRAQFVRVIGILGLIEVAPDQDVWESLEKLRPYVSRGALKASLASGHPKLIALTLTRFSDQISARQLLPLLQHEEKQVRLAAVRALAGLNDLEVLQGVLRAYEQERDEEVRALYQEVHWVVHKQ